MERQFGKSIKQSLPDKIGENASRLATLMTTTDWKKVGKIWLVLHFALLFSIFTIIAVVRLANKI